MKETVTKPTITCFNCDKSFTNRITFNRHLKNNCIPNPIDDVSNRMDTIERHFTISFVQAMQGCYNKYTFIPKDHIGNEKQCLELLEDDIIATIQYYSNNQIFFKWSYTMEAMFTRMTIEGDDEFKSAGFSSTEQAYDNIEADRIPDLFNEMRNNIIARVDDYCKEGSGWTICRILSFKLCLYRFNINSGGYGAIVLPPALVSKHCVINIASDNCFKWAVLSALHYKE